MADLISMKRRWNSSIWIGFFLIIAGLLSYVPIFALFPITRDFPWANLLLFLAGGFFMGKGLVFAFRFPELYRGKIFGSILAILGTAGVALFVYGLLYLGRQMPPSSGAPQVGQKAPEFRLADENGSQVSLADLLSHSSAGVTAQVNGVLLIFYRGYW